MGNEIRLTDAAVLRASDELLEGGVTPDEVLEWLDRLISERLPEAEPKPVPPRDTAGSTLAGIGAAVAIVVGVFVLPNTWGVGWPIATLVTLAVGAALAMFSHGTWESRGAFEARLLRAKRDAEQQWMYDVRRITDDSFARIGESVAAGLDVPERLHRDFVVRLHEQSDLHLYEWAEELEWWSAQPDYPEPPLPVDAPLTPYEYEQYCCLWLQSLGFMDAEITRSSRDGGIDILSSEVVAQCKHYSGTVGAPAVRELFGLATHLGRVPAFFTSGQYSREAKSFGEAAGVALFRVVETVGYLDRVTTAAKRLRPSTSRSS